MQQLELFDAETSRHPRAAHSPIEPAPAVSFPPGMVDRGALVVLSAEIQDREDALVTVCQPCWAAFSARSDLNQAELTRIVVAYSEAVMLRVRAVELSGGGRAGLA